MSQGTGQNELQAKTQQLLQGPLKHVRAAALAAALLPLASVAAAPASAQESCPAPASAGISLCGFVWNDTNGDGVQGPGELGIVGSTVTLGSFTSITDGNGFYHFIDIDLPAGTYVVIVDDNQNGTQSSPPNVGDDAKDSDGMASGTTVTVQKGETLDVDFGFTPSDASDGEVPTPCDFLTSGGFVINDAGKKVTFGIHGGCKNGEFWGHLNVLDHATGYHISSTDVTAYIVPTNGTQYTREICGLATTNSPADPASVFFRVRLIDNGEPGRLDLFGIRLSTGYHVTTRLLSDLKPGGGNIQLHDQNPSTTIAPGVSAQCWGVLSPDTK